MIAWFLHDARARALERAGKISLQREICSMAHMVIAADSQIGVPSWTIIGTLPLGLSFR